MFDTQGYRTGIVLATVCLDLTVHQSDDLRGETLLVSVCFGVKRSETLFACSAAP